MRKRKKKQHYSSEQDFLNSLIKTPKTRLTTVCLAVRYNAPQITAEIYSKETIYKICQILRGK